MRNLKYFAWLNGFTWFGNSCKKFVKLWDFEKTENLFHGKIGFKFFKVTCRTIWKMECTNLQYE